MAALAAAGTLAVPVGAQGDGSGCVTPYLLRPSAEQAAEIRVDPAGRLCAPSPFVGYGESSSDRRPGSEGTAPGPARAFAVSLVLPGGGQWLQGQSRAYLYLGLEAAAWGGYLQGRLEGADLRSRYRDLAWEVARGGEGQRRDDGDFRFYEALAQYPASGSWDRDPDRPGIQPETDPETYNGRIWNLARELYSLSGEDENAEAGARERALEYYRRHGYPPGMSWDWTEDPEAAARYRSLIEESDDAFRRATVVLAVIAANHVLSAVDGFLSARIASGRTDPNAARSRLSGPGDRTRWSLRLSFGGRP